MADSVASGGGTDLHSHVNHVCVAETGVWDSQTTKGLQNLLNRCHRAQDWEAALAAARVGGFVPVVRFVAVEIHVGFVSMYRREY